MPALVRALAIHMLPFSNRLFLLAHSSTRSLSQKTTTSTTVVAAK